MVTNRLVSRMAEPPWWTAEYGFAFHSKSFPDNPFDCLRGFSPKGFHQKAFQVSRYLSNDQISTMRVCIVLGASNGHISFWDFLSHL